LDNLRKAKRIFETPGDGHFFFGYYDKVQLSEDETKFLAMRVAGIEEVPTADDVAEIGYFDIKNNPSQFVKLGETRAFNWQQGCMLQWLGPDYNSRILFNDLRDGRFVSVVINLDTKEEKVSGRAIYNVTPDSLKAISVDFERHYWCRRGYSYDGVYDENKNKPVVEGDGLWLVDLETGAERQVVALADLISNKPLSNMDNATHYVEHVHISPDGKRMAFLHRWKIADGGIYARLYTAKIDGSELYLLNDSGRVGHFNWFNENEVLAYCGLENKINKIRKYKTLVKFFIKPLLPVYHMLIKDNSKISKMVTGDSYVIFKDQSEIRRRIALKISDEDGHPSARRGYPNQFITDTYPDPEDSPQAKLILYDLEKDEPVYLDYLGSIARHDNSATRCDLHPRVSLNGRYVSIDTMDRGVRGTYLYDLEVEK